MSDSALPGLVPAQPALIGADVIELIADSVICTDEDGHIRLFNPAAEQAFGYRASEVLGKHVEILLPERYRTQHAGEVRRFAQGDGSAKRLMGHRGEVWGRRKDGEEFPAEAIMSRHTVHGRTILAVVHRDISLRKEIEEQREAVAREMDHRIRNLLSVVKALISLSARSSLSVGDLRDSILGRVDALAATQSALRFGAKQSTPLSELLLSELEHYRTPDGANIIIEGPSVSVGSRSAQSLALIFHELATNSVKYGALSVAGGLVTVSSAFMQRADRRFVDLQWRETGGPQVEQRRIREGFGTNLIRQVTKATFRVDVFVDYRREGLICRLELPRDKLEASHG